MMTENIDIILPTAGKKSRSITMLAVRSFLEFSEGFNFRIFVVENSNDNSYRDDVLGLSENVFWIQNPIQSQDEYAGSLANAKGLERGLEEVDSEYVFLCHNDVIACHQNWMRYLFNKVKKEGYSLCGFQHDEHPDRIFAAHISGILTKTEIAKTVSLRPSSGSIPMDVGDSLTKYCRDNDLKYFICENTKIDHLANPKINKWFDGTYIENHRNGSDWYEKNVPSPFKSSSSVKSFDDDLNVVWMHLGRGTPKARGNYSKANNKNKTSADQWTIFADEYIFNGGQTCEK